MKPALNAVTLPGLGALTLPSFDTHVPFVGVVDLGQPMEWVFWGGMIVDLVFVKGISKWVIAAGIVAARYELGKRGSK